MPPKSKHNRTTKKIKTEELPSKNLCIVCGVDIGDANPRQLCGKTYCMYMDDFTDLLKVEDLPDEESSTDEKSTEKSTEKTTENTANKTPEKTTEDKSPLIIKLVRRKPDKIESPDSSEETIGKDTKNIFDIKDTKNIKDIKDNKNTKDTKDNKPRHTIGRLRPRTNRGFVARGRFRQNSRLAAKQDPDWAESETESSESIESAENTENEYDDLADTDEEEYDADDTDDPDDAEDQEYTDNPDNTDDSDGMAKLITAIKQFAENKEKMYMDMQYAPDTHMITEEDQISMLRHIRIINQNKVPSVKKILAAPCNVELKAKAIEYLIRVLNNTPELSEEWIKVRNKINKMITNPNNLTDESYNEYLRVMRQKNTPTVADVLRATMSTAKKIELIELLELADRDFTHPVDAKKYIDKVRRDLFSLDQLDPALQVLVDSEESKLLDKGNLQGDSFSIEKQIAEKYDTPLAAKILSEYINGMKMSSDDKYKTVQWAKYIVSMPSEIKPFPVNLQSSVGEIREFRARVQEKFDAKIFGMQTVKNYLINYVMHVISSGTTHTTLNESTAKNHILALCGPPGIGKTTIANSIADCIGLPFVPISIGGQGDACELKGHSRTYVRAVPGKIVQGLSGLKYKNAVIFIDEVDKISGRHENELAGILTHLLDPSANHAFVDDYLGYPIDLSHAVFVLAFNDASKINPILRDRMEIMHLKGYSKSEKIEMLRQYLLPREAHAIGFNVFNEQKMVSVKNTPKMRTLQMSKDALDKLVTKSKVKEEGVRQLIRNLRTVLKKINTLVLTQDEKFITANYDISRDVIVISGATMDNLFEEAEELVNKSEPPASMYN